MSHNPHHPPDVITVQSGSVEVVLPPHLKSRCLEGTRKTFGDSDREAYISVIRVEEPDGTVFTYGPTRYQPFEVEITYRCNEECDQPAPRITIASNTGKDKSVVVKIPNQLRRKVLDWYPFYKTFKENAGQIDSVRVSSGQTELHVSSSLKGNRELQIMYYRRGFLRRLVDYFKPSALEEQHDPAS